VSPLLALVDDPATFYPSDLLPFDAAHIRVAQVGFAETRSGQVGLTKICAE
jgi:hypothetical protein